MRLAKRSVKLILFLLCVIFLFFGSALIALGIVACVDNGDFSEVIGSALYTSAVYILIFSGLIILLTSLCGYLGTQKENRCLLIIYVLVHILCILFVLIAGIIALATRSALTDATRSAMKNTLKNQYGRYSIVTATWDLIQSKLRCCAVDNRGWADYQGSWWDNFENADINNSTYATIPKSNVFYKFVPPSCCWKLVDPLTGWPTHHYLSLMNCQNFQFGPPNLPSGPQNTGIYYGGCFTAIKSYMAMFAIPLGIIALIALILMIVAVIIGIVLLGMIKAKRD